MKTFFNIYNASAGSGKTFTLVKEYLVLLFTSTKTDSYKNILAITFTNKAVGEMKKRIIDSLLIFRNAETSAENNPLFKTILEETSISSEEIKRKSAEILKSIIHNYAAFEISTIDGFTHRVLRTFARDLGIPMNFEVEMETDEILAEAVDSLISKAGTDKKLTAVLLDFTLTKTDDDKSWDISRDLFAISKLLTNENNQKAISVLKEKSIEDFQNFAKKLKGDIQKSEKELKATAEDFFNLINKHGIDAGWFTRGSVPGHFKKIRDGKNKLNFTANWALNIEEGNLYNKSLEDVYKSTMDAAQPEFAALFFKSKSAFFRIEFLKEIQKNLVQLSLLNEINKEIENIKKERNLMLISEFNPKISEQVKDQPAPFIYERLGDRYRHYFIDEFQDTSVMQWENLIPLIDHNLSGKEENAGLTLVGDAKQSIYRWRGGRAEQFISLYNKAENPFQVLPELKPLDQNWRSGSEIVNFNNSFFEYASEKLSLPVYSDLFKNARQIPRKGDFGYVNLQFIEAQNKEEQMELYPPEIHKHILELDKDGFDRGDICILTRKREEGAVIAEYLSRQNIAVVSSETLLLENSEEVNFVIDVIALSLKEEDKQLKFRVFDYLSKKYLKDETFEIFLRNIDKTGNDFYSWLTEFDIHFDNEFLKRQSLYEGVEYIIRSFQLTESPDAYIQFFLDFVFEVSQKHASSFTALLENWDHKKHKLNIVTPEASGAVRIMTIHKSKGLEFPVVIYPFANSELQDTRKDSLWLHLENENIPVAYVNASSKLLNWNDEAAQAYTELICQKELDTLNVFYVACTRASERLYVMSDFHEKPKSSANIPDMLWDFATSQNSDLEKKEFHIGEKSGPKIQKEKAQEIHFAKNFFSSPIQNQAVNIVTRAGAMWDSSQQEAIEKGEVIHEILAHIDESEDLNNAVEWAVVNGLITETEKGTISETISGIINHEILKAYFSRNSDNFNERDIITAEGERLRPDRLNFQGKNVSIIDYKTGGFVDEHENQVKKYANTLKKMGFHIEKSLLVYTHDPVSIKEVKEN